MRVFVTGATGVLGRAAVASLLADGHEVTGLARTPEKRGVVEALGADSASAQLFDVDAMAASLQGFDAVCNLVTSIPTGITALRPGAWKANDRLRTQASKALVAAATAAGVRRLVQESVSFLYAAGGDEWITESSPLAVTRAVEPAAVAESNASLFGCGHRESVVLRFGNLIGDDAMTRWRLAQARSGRAVGIGHPQGWAHVVHPSDAGSAVTAALSASPGIYNVGAEPVRRAEMAAVFAEAARRPEVGFMPRFVVKLAGERLEPLTRSHRISADKLHQATGWKPRHDTFEMSWLPDLASR
ncbi:MAG: NAD(P)-dependent oxidoreductase [Nocardioidaceae bacterium]|nr:NAD(P)-dependent oxidoreductase [Nocardioidaceae bacterium]